MNILEKDMTHTVRERELVGEYFIILLSTGHNLTYEQFISGIFHLIFWTVVDHG
jgi:hypothetical protein